MWVFIVAGLVFAFLGSVLHELTHALAARVVGAEVREINLYRLYVEYEVTGGAWKDRVIGMAPLTIGVGIGAVTYLVRGVPSSDLGLAALIGWAIYTFWGSTEDLSPKAAQEAAEPDPRSG